MSLDINRPTDKERGIVTLKIGEECRNRLRQFVASNEKFKKYDDAIFDLLYVYENFVDRFIEEYVNSLNKCKNCPELNNPKKCNFDRNGCDIRKIHHTMEECQKLGNKLFNLIPKITTIGINLLNDCIRCPKLNTNECKKCETRSEFQRLENLITKSKQIFK